MQWYKSDGRTDSLADCEHTISTSATPFDRLPIGALLLLTIIANAAGTGLVMTRPPTRARLLAMLRTAWDVHELSVEALQEPEALFHLLRNSFKKQLVQ
jgi:hypothetical protein